MMGTILIIEDEPLILELMISCLESEGFVASGALTAEDAIARFGNEPPALLLIDYGVGGQAGRSLQAVRAYAPWRGVPVVLVSGHANIAALAKQEKVDGWLAKPFEIEELAEIVRRYLP